MKNFNKKSILQKTIIAILIALLLSNFIVPTYSHADASEFGGVLISPIVDLICSLGDAVINLLQTCMTGNFASSEAINWSLSAFLMESEEYYRTYGRSANGSTTATVNPDSEFDKGWLGLKDQYYIPVSTYSPEQIFSDNVAGLDINFINPNKYDGQYESAASKLQPAIASWYVALRNLTVVGLLSVLVYVGIRMIISSNAGDKAKYKQMLMDWVIALCLVFFLHYIMAFTLTLTQSITHAIGGDGTHTVVVEDISANSKFGTNLLGLARFQTQYKEFGAKMAYLIMYLALVIYTLIFTWFYLKRLLMMAFLTLIAPVVALTYPIDKISDGKSQAFDAWLKEYVFNALIQPFHLIIYTVFVGTAMDLASTNIIYMIAALAFILPAEKILRKFFGFEKAGAGTLGALAGGAALGSMTSKAIKSLGGGGGSSKKAPSGGGESKPTSEKPPRFESKHDVNQIEGNSNIDNDDTEEPTALDRYSEEGYGQNSNGEYYNPWTDEYDADYDPNNDLAYGNLQNDNLENDNMEKNNLENDNPENDNDRNNNKISNGQSKENKRNNAFINWTRAHDITPGNIAKGAGKKLIKGAASVAKFGTKTAFKAAAGTLPAAVAIASGSGLGGATTAFIAGAAVGDKLGNRVVNVGRFAAKGVSRVGKGIAADWNAKDGEHGTAFANAMLGGTRLGKEIDLAKGNTRYQDIGSINEWKSDKNNMQYLKEQMAAQNNGNIPSAKEVKNQMDSFDPYLAEGLTDIKDMLKAQKAEQYGISSKQSAIIAAIGKEKGISSEVLNDDKKFNAQRNNMIHEHMSKGKNQTEATRITDHTMNVLKVQNGVANNLKKVDKSQPVKPVKPPKTNK